MTPPRPSTPLAVPGGTRPNDVAALLTALRDRLTGDGPAVLPVDPASPPRPAAGTVPPEVAVVVSTSGSTTGTGQRVALDAAAVVASAEATHERLGGPGQWLACLPAHHVAGLQVLLRSVVAGTEPVVLDAADGFRPEALAAAARSMRDDVPTYVSLVPTQLARVMAAGPETLAAVSRFGAVLVGGAGTPAALLDQARAAGVRVVTTYGMTETSGGCVYDGVPLRGVDVEVDDEQRVWLAGPVLARGYLDDADATAQAFAVRDGRRWLRTADRGALDDGALTVLGRLDDVILSGGLNVDAGAVARVVHEDPALAQAVVVGVPDDHWGSLVTVVVTGPPPPLAELRDRIGARLGRAQAPRAVVAVAELPMRGPGKVDRRAVAELARQRLAAGSPGTDRLT
ncbi:o-succinylbenzoate--CoA ligase [Georgenia sunbinii]|uniref:o-succinylbenzoate--CoA ligase n=1 Tax=Georgenia sunbinii TaxID=3117728 RepID=UPI002F26CFCE